MRLVLITLALAALSGPSAAQDPGDIGIFFDEAGTQTSIVVETGVPFDLFVVSFGVPGGQDAYEFGILVPDELLVTLEEFRPPGASNFCHRSANRWSYCVGTWQCYGGASTVLIRLRMQIRQNHDPADLQLCLVAALPSSSNPPKPVYLKCDCPGAEPECIAPYSRAYEGCAVINPTLTEPPVALQARRWSSVKARFAGEQGPRRP